MFCGTALIGLFIGAVFEWRLFGPLTWGMSRESQIAAVGISAWGLIAPSNFSWIIFSRLLGRWKTSPRIVDKFKNSWILAGVAVVLGSAVWTNPATVAVLVFFWFVFIRLLGNFGQSERSALKWFLLASAGTRLLIIFCYYSFATLKGWTAAWVTIDFPPYEVPVLFGDGADAIQYSRATATYWRGFRVSASDLYEVFNPDRSFLDIHGDVRHLLPQTVLFYLFGVEPIAARVLSALVGVLGAFLSYLTLRGRFGKNVAWTAAILISFWPTLFAWSIDALKEPYVLLLIVASALFSTRFAEERRWYDLVLSLAFLGMALSIRTRFYPVIYGTSALCLGGYFVHRGLRHESPTKRIAGGIMILLFLIGLTLAWPSSRRILVENTYRGFTAHLSFSQSPAGYKVWPRSYYTHLGTLEDVERKKAFSIKDWPGAWLRNLGHVLVEPLPRRGKFGALLAILGFGWWLAVLFAAVGTYIVAVRRDGVGWLFVVYVCLCFGFLAMFSGNAGTLIRQRDIATPLLLILTAIGAGGCFRLLRAQSRKE